MDTLGVLVVIIGLVLQVERTFDKNNHLTSSLRHARIYAARTERLCHNGSGLTDPPHCCWSRFLRWARGTGWRLISSPLCSVCRASDWQPLWQPWQPSWGRQSGQSLLHEMVRWGASDIWEQEVLAEVGVLQGKGEKVETSSGILRVKLSARTRNTRWHTLATAGPAQTYRSGLWSLFIIAIGHTYPSYASELALNQCSFIQDLGVYMRQNLTDPTRLCGALGAISPSLMRNCLKRIGFSDDCIPIWEYNILNTRKECFLVKNWTIVHYNGQ